MFDGLFGAIGSVASAAIAANAMQNAIDKQIASLKEARDFVFNQLDPTKINAEALAADVQSANARLALQGQIDPKLLEARYQGEASQAELLKKLGVQSESVANQAVTEAMTGQQGMMDAKNKLISDAMAQLQQGATLPPDVQAEMVKSGLEASGMVTQHAGAKGVGGQQLRTIIGQAGVNLQMKRQQQASEMLSSAQNLETSRQNILQNLFPRLTQNQLSTLQGNQSAIELSNKMLPQAGLSGTSVANIWMSRVGATNQINQDMANAQAQAGMNMGNIWSRGAGGAISSIGGMIPKSGGGGGGGGWGGPSGGGYDMSTAASGSDWSSFM
jgi:hypothetical protein